MKDPVGIFKDPVNPTKSELKKWAYENYFCPEQDFELYVTDDPMYISQFVIDENCPTGQFFLSSLYTWTGDMIRGNHQNEIKFINWLKYARSLDNKHIVTLIRQTNELLSNPSSYKYEEWGMGGALARNNI